MVFTRTEARKLLSDLIHQAISDNDQGLANHSRPTADLVEKALTMMGFTGPSRVNLDGLEGLIQEATGPDNREARHYPLVFRSPTGARWRHVTVDLQEVVFRGFDGEGETYHAAVVSLHDD